MQHLAPLTPPTNRPDPRIALLEEENNFLRQLLSAQAAQYDQLLDAFMRITSDMAHTVAVAETEKG